MINQDEAAFLTEITELLGACETPRASEAVQHELKTVAGHESLLFASHQLVAETEKLLSSISTSTNTRSLELSERRKAQNANAAKRRLKYCKKIESEREQLKRQEKELVVELAELQAKNQVIFEKTQTMPVWKAIATRQLQSRLEAEAERRRLRATVTTRSKLLQELGEKLQRHLVPLHPVEMNSIMIEPDDTVLFERYLQEMDGAYGQVSSILHAWGVNDAPLYSFRPDAKQLRDGNVEYFESLSSQMTPFNFQKTGDALWKSLRLLHQRKSRHYQYVSNPENTLAVKFRIPGQSSAAGQTDLLVRMVFSRRIEAGQTVILWRAHTQGEGEISDFQADETGWSVVRPTDTCTRKAIGMPTASLTFIRFIPNGKETGDKTKVGKFLKLAETSGNEDGSELARMMESLLLDDSLGIRP
ncbi:Hypothetical protein PHPALM_4902 [Phytophthora palmivora]|uniref:M96 mating-specific protein family n=1 Tax=Phytophthora palmivora TaxID=4796 RepID=A0A2P4YIW4_9STRA|nr:Hypothetical protein PHPALM_4902 [Phytophthora palmivora]